MIRTAGTVAAVLIVGCTPTPGITAAEPAEVEFHQVPRTVAAPSARPTHRASRSRSPLPTVMLRIRSCESGPNGYATHGWAFDFDYTLTNPASTASGAWQFLDGTWHSTTGLSGRAKDYPPTVQDRAALKLYAAEGTRPWNASRSCWGSGRGGYRVFEKAK